MEFEENAPADAQAMENANPATENAIADEIKAVPMGSAEDDGDFGEKSENAGNEAAAADSARRERPRRPAPPPVKPASAESMEEARSVLAHMFDFLGIDANVRVENKPRSVNLYVSTEEPGRVIGHHGKTLENLQLIVNRIMQKTDSEFPKLYIDMDGSRERRERPERADRPERHERTERPERESRGERGERSSRREYRGERRDRGDRDGGRRSSFSHDDVLRQQALDAAKEVHQWGSPKTLPPMNSHDRRIVHITLESDTALTTNSIGDGENRSVVIALKDEVNA
jgi:predicted RNA-binding protein Jag